MRLFTYVSTHTVAYTRNTGVHEGNIIRDYTPLKYRVLSNSSPQICRNLILNTNLFTIIIIMIIIINKKKATTS